MGVIFGYFFNNNALNVSIGLAMFNLKPWGLPASGNSLEFETAIFRIVQESLTNVLLHAHASRADVLISQRKNLLSVIIEDNGVGFIPENVATHTHLGLFGMRERVEMLGGKFSIESNLGKGTLIQVEVPNGN